jgi:hypothetical protein
MNNLLLAMINQSYELNQFIPNIELLLFKLFVSPLKTKELRKGNKDLLAGNIIKYKLDNSIYKSLL